MLPSRLGAVGGCGIPVRATLLVTGITGSLVLLGDLAQVAALTDAAVPLSFMLVNLSLSWLARRGATGPGLARRTLDLALPRWRFSTRAGRAWPPPPGSRFSDWLWGAGAWARARMHQRPRRHRVHP